MPQQPPTKHLSLDTWAVLLASDCRHVIIRLGLVTTVPW
jgi:hypothetical protein